MILCRVGNDDRYVSNVRDVRYSVFESLIRSIEHRRLELHRKFPKTESLKVLHYVTLKCSALSRFVDPLEYTPYLPPSFPPFLMLPCVT